MQKLIVIAAMLLIGYSSNAQTAQEKSDYEAMLLQTTEESAEAFCRKYPNSVYKEEALLTWQTRMLQNAKQLNYTDAIVKLEKFKKQFPSSSLYSQARSLYELKWGEAQAESKQKFIAARNAKNDYVSHKAKRLGRQMLLAPVFFGAGYALGYYTEERSKQKGLTYGAILGGIGIVVPLSSFSVKTGPYKRDMKKWQRVSSHYSGQPNY